MYRFSEVFSHSIVPGLLAGEVNLYSRVVFKPIVWCYHQICVWCSDVESEVEEQAMG